jgi:hypothetical protein
MRNTHFGDQGFGFSSKTKNEMSLDSERQISRKRGGGHQTQLGGNTNLKKEESLRESVHGNNNDRNDNKRQNNQTSIGMSNGSHLLNKSSTF